MNLRIKIFFGREPNAVYTQVWCVIAIYTLLLIIKKQLNLKASMYTILTVVSLNIFEKVPLRQLFIEFELTNDQKESHNQLVMNY